MNINLETILRPIKYNIVDANVHTQIEKILNMRAHPDTNDYLNIISNEAITSNNMNIIKYLIKKNYLPSNIDMFKHSSIQMKRLLLQYGYKLNIKDVHYAIDFQQIDILNLYSNFSNIGQMIKNLRVTDDCINILDYCLMEDKNVSLDWLISTGKVNINHINVKSLKKIIDDDDTYITKDALNKWIGNGKINKYICSFNKCYQGINDNNYNPLTSSCNKHKCKVNNCLEHMMNKNTNYCQRHKCIHNNCTNKKINKYRSFYCDQHTCKLSLCDEMKSQFSGKLIYQKTNYCMIHNILNIPTTIVSSSVICYTDTYKLFDFYKYLIENDIPSDIFKIVLRIINLSKYTS